MHYCQENGTTSCCFLNEKCSNDYYKSVHGGMETKAFNFLKDPKKYLKSMVETLGYNSCHRIDGIDASICAKDCERHEESDLAEKCKENGGLFKCCIR